MSSSPLRSLIGLVGLVALVVGFIGAARESGVAETPARVEAAKTAPAAASRTNRPADKATPAQVRKATTWLAALPVARPASMSGYDRDRFRHWTDRDGNGCNAREDTLIRDGAKVRTGAGCKVLSGSWYDPYAGGTYTNPRQIDIDHMVPLAAAWRAGANRWNAAAREKFANAPGVLIAVSASQNRSKSDQDPSTWRPPRRAYWQKYAVHWIAIKHNWRLTVTPAEKNALGQMLRTKAS